MRPKKTELHELPHKEIVKYATSVLQTCLSGYNLTSHTVMQDGPILHLFDFVTFFVSCQNVSQQLSSEIECKHEKLVIFPLIGQQIIRAIFHY